LSFLKKSRSKSATDTGGPYRRWRAHSSESRVSKYLRVARPESSSVTAISQLRDAWSEAVRGARSARISALRSSPIGCGEDSDRYATRLSPE
jgi:hypothetical protein